MKNLAKTLIFAGLILSMSSCGDSEAEYKYTQYYTNSYAIVTDIKTGEQSVSNSVVVKSEINVNKGIIYIDMSGLKVNGNSYPQISLLNLLWTSSNTWGVAENTYPNALLSTNFPVDVTNFKYRWTDRMNMPAVDNQYANPYIMTFNFELEQQYKVAGGNMPFTFWGTTSSATAGQEPFISKVNPLIAIPDFENMTVSIVVCNSQFADRMPSMDIQLNKIPMTIIDEGKSFEFSIAELIPELDNVPVPDYPCSNISGVITPGESMTLTFDCNVRRMMTYTVTTTATVFGYLQ